MSAGDPGSDDDDWWTGDRDAAAWDTDSSALEALDNSLSRVSPDRMDSVAGLMREQDINGPSISGFALVFLRGLVRAAVLSAVLTFVTFLWTRSVSDHRFAAAVLILCGLWFLIVTLQSCAEPILVLQSDGLVVQRWASRLLHIGHGRRYPIQALNPVEVILHGRGGPIRVVQLTLFDFSGAPHRIRFFFISLARFEAALAQSWYRHLA